MKLIAHRGASHDAPENTVAAVNLAWRQHADAVEVDVHLSRDGRLVVIHDGNTRRTAEKNRRVGRQSMAELHKLDAGRWKGHRWSGERIPTLEEVMACVPAGRRLFVEVKCRKNTAPELHRVFARTDCKSAQVILICFSLQVVALLKRAFPEVEVCWLAELRRHWRTRRYPNAEKLIEKVTVAGLDGLDLRANGAITPEFVKKIHGAGLKIYVWTVDALADAKKMADAGVDGITTNRPGWLREHLGWHMESTWH